ncbi:hypothetical protein GGI12_001820 [Dipsacomyces acuminosporus]|nr:hypothetical protein GGI12_001820 [Dipsacomyces acuminosporus]
MSNYGYGNNNNNNNNNSGSGRPSQYGQQQQQQPHGGQYPPSGPAQGGNYGRQGQDAPNRPGPQGGPQQSGYGGPASGPQGRPQGSQYGEGNRPGSNVVGGGSQYGDNAPGDDYSTEDVEKSARNAKYKDWAGKAAIGVGALAAVGAAAFGVHEYKEHKQEKREEERRREEDRRREEEEEEKEEEDRRRQEQEKKHQQQEWNYRPEHGRYDEGQQHNQGHQQQQQQQQQQFQNSGYGNSGGSGGSGFRPPAPFGRPAYSYDKNDVRQPDPSRSSENSPTPHEYPQLRQNSSDTTIKIGTIVALKHNMTGRFLHSDRSHSTQSGSNQQLVFGYRWNIDQNDWWQVLPANRDVPVPGQVVTYGTQIRLRHVETGRHLHSHYNYSCPKSGQNEVTAYGDAGHSDENDHWVIERWGDGGYGQTWSANDVVVLRHYVSGMTLHSHELLLSEDVQSVTAFGPGNEENDKWRVHLTQ